MKNIRVIDLLYLLENGELSVTLKSDECPLEGDTAKTLLENCTEFYLFGLVNSWNVAENLDTGEIEVVINYEPYC